jgi:preprotein translocase subunit SecA
MVEPSQKGEESFRGIPVSAGVCRGRILVIGRSRPGVGRRDLSEPELQDEISRLERSLVQTRHQILEVQRRVSEGMGAAEGSIFDAHLLVLEDRTLLDEVIRVIQTQKVNAEYAFHAVAERYAEKEKQFSPDLLRWLERRIILDVVDSQWKDHLLSLDHLTEGIGLRGYGQKDPLVEFKKEAFILFEDMMARIDNETVRYLFHVQIQQEAQPAQPRAPQPEPPRPRPSTAIAAAASAAARAEDAAPQRLPDFARALERRQERQQRDLQYQTGAGQAEAPKPVRAGAKVGRNDPCPCGSGKKYKKCHGANS